MSLSSREITTDEKTAKDALKKAREDIKAITHLISLRTITVEDLLTHKSLASEHERLEVEHQEWVKSMAQKIEEAKEKKMLALRTLKTVQAQKKLLQNSLAMKKTESATIEEIPPTDTASSTKVTRQPSKISTAPSASLFRPHRNTFRDDLMDDLMLDLKAYIQRIRGYADEQGVIDFAYGFTVYPRSRAINRIANYLLASSLLKKLRRGKPIYEVFNNIDKQRKDLIVKYNLNTLADYEERDIHSATLNAIIDKAKNYLVSEKQPLLLRRII